MQWVKSFCYIPIDSAHNPLQHSEQISVLHALSDGGSVKNGLPPLKMESTPFRYKLDNIQSGHCYLSDNDNNLSWMITLTCSLHGFSARIGTKYALKKIDELNLMIWYNKRINTSSPDRLLPPMWLSVWWTNRQSKGQANTAEKRRERIRKWQLSKNDKKELSLTERWC